MAYGSRGFRISIFAVALAFISAAGFAIADHQRSIQLRPGESYTTQDQFGSITIHCAATAQPPGYPDQPGYPGAPGCSIFEFDSKSRQINVRRDLLVRGECAYRYADGFTRCDGFLDRYEVRSQKEAFQRDLLELKSLVEMSCRSRTCSQLEISRMLREYDALVNSAQFSRIPFDGYQSVPLLDFPQNFRVTCSSW